MSLAAVENTGISKSGPLRSALRNGKMSRVLRAGHSLAQEAIVDGALEDPQPLGAELKAVLAAMLDTDVPLEASGGPGVGGGGRFEARITFRGEIFFVMALHHFACGVCIRFRWLARFELKNYCTSRVIYFLVIYTTKTVTLSAHHARYTIITQVHSPLAALLRRCRFSTARGMWPSRWEARDCSLHLHGLEVVNPDALATLEQRMIVTDIF